MADDKRIDELTQATELGDDDLFVLQQQGEAKSLLGSTLKQLLSALGVSIASIEQTTTSTADGGDNVFTVTLSNGETATFTVKNGSKGSTGEPGVDGADGSPGATGQNGADGVSPTVEIIQLGNNHFITITDAEGEHTFTVYNGEDGITPHIGTNGNWYIGTTDTGISATGPAGQDGAKGDKGDTGEKGEKGDKGDTGATGAAGADGADGEDGQNGYSVYVSSVVSESDRIIITLYDEKNASERKITLYHGADGADGADGVGISSIGQTTLSTADGGDNVFTVTLTNGGRATFTVKNGSKGSTGAAGEKGDKGDTGAAGAQGEQGIQGEKGEKGDTGAAGADGADGVTFTPSVDAEGNLSWSNDGGLTNPATVNIKGPAGADGASGTVSVPDYWQDHLAEKASAIQTAMEQAGRNKSAFLWYTDAHWPNGNSKVSPVLLKYLYEHTPMNKVNFGGDIIGDSLLATRDDMEYLYEWRKAIKGLPNHHSVEGNHDRFTSDSVDYEGENYTYAFLLAPEESPDMVMGEGNYYYIDNPAEKTRYLYFAYITANQTAMLAQGQFMVDAIKGVPEGWHIVAISHRWWQYSSSSTPTTGSVPAYLQEMLNVFDEYNARGTHSASNYFYAQDFSECVGKVEFCIGGHIHVDYDFASTGGIPIIITTADTNQDRVPDSTVDSGTTGTTTEAAVFGIVADYNDSDKTKITVVGVGRGTSRVITASGSTTVVPTTVAVHTYSGDTTVGATIDTSKIAYTLYYSDGTSVEKTDGVAVYPTTIEAVGENVITVIYTEDEVEVLGEFVIVGTEAETTPTNLFDATDTDLLDTGRFNSSKVAVAYQSGQLITGYIEAKVGDTFTITTDKSLKTNGYTGTAMTYDASKTAIFGLTNATTVWTFSDDGLTGTVPIPSAYGSNDLSSTTYVRFCVAYTDMDNIVITKA